MSYLKILIGIIFTFLICCQKQSENADSFHETKISSKFLESSITAFDNNYLSLENSNVVIVIVWNDPAVEKYTFFQPNSLSKIKMNPPFLIKSKKNTYYLFYTGIEKAISNNFDINLYFEKFWVKDLFNIWDPPIVTYEKIINSNSDTSFVYSGIETSFELQKPYQLANSVFLRPKEEGQSH